MDNIGERFGKIANSPEVAPKLITFCTFTVSMVCLIIIGIVAEAILN